MAGNPLLNCLRNYGAKHRKLGIDRCNEWACQSVARLAPQKLVDIGCGDGDVLYSQLKVKPAEYHGVEGAPALQKIAESRGIKVCSFDLNGRWPYPDNYFDVVFSSQVIEHIHNTRLFVEEAYRVLKPGGTAIVASENLASLLNLLALSMGYTPFSLMQICGRYLGNPIGLHSGEPIVEYVPIDHPAFAGIAGHIRVLTVRQAKELFEWTGFKADVRSISILPLPDGLSRLLEGWIRSRGHYLTIEAKKPQ